MDKESIIATLREFSLVVLEIDRNNRISGSWTKDVAPASFYHGLSLSEGPADKIPGITRQLIEEIFSTGISRSVFHDLATVGRPYRVVIKLSPAAYSKDHLVATIDPVLDDTRHRAADQWKTALDAIGDGIWEMNLQSGEIFFSDKWHDIFGYSEHEITRISQWEDKIHPEDLGIARRNFEDYIAGLRSFYMAEIRYLCKTGGYKWVLSRGVLTSTDSNGQPQYFIGTHTDISERKAHEKQTHNNEEKYRILFDYCEAMICTHDLNGVILTINPFVTRALGYRQQDLIGKPLVNLIPKHLRERFRTEYLSTIQSTGQAEGIMQIVDLQGNIKLLLYRNYLFRDTAEEHYVIGYAQDITDRVKAEEALKESVNTFQGAFRYSGIGMALVSADGRWLEVNEALCILLGYDREELLKTTFQNLTFPEDLEKDLALVNRVLAGEIDNYRMEKRYISKTGKTIWATLTVSIVRNKNASASFFISQIEDITERRTLTNELYEKNAALEQAKRSLTTKVNQLEELSYIIAHNLRGPSRNILLLTEALQLQLDSSKNGSDEAAILATSMAPAENAGMIHDAAMSLFNSLESLLNVAQIRLNKNITFDSCMFAEQIEHISQQLKADILEKGVQITTDLQVSSIQYPKPYLESIFYNLISNAIKYRNPAVVPHIHISTAVSNEGMVTLSVSDNGLGIDLERYGKQVFQLNKVFHGHHDSKGIGLFMTKTQIESLGGYIEVQSKVGVGTTFTVTF